MYCFTDNTRTVEQIVSVNWAQIYQAGVRYFYVVSLQSHYSLLSDPFQIVEEFFFSYVFSNLTTQLVSGNLW